MKKTVNINLNSFNFSIDEDAYNVLNNYLSQLQKHFAPIEEGNEIIHDIEARIAEIFNMKINENKQVINISDIDELIKILGKVEDITGESISNNNESEESTTKNKKKLYRDPDSRYLGGVCSGLSYYTGISATTWRILFMLFLFVGQVSLIAYIILWIAVPEAKTTTEKIEMKGDKINLSNIEKTVKQEYEDLKNDLKNIKSKKATETIKNIGNAIFSVFKVMVKIFIKLLGLSFIILGAIILVSLTVGLLSVSNESLYFSNDFIHMIWLPGLLEHITTTGTSWLLSISILIVFIIPIISIIYWGILLIFKVKSNKYINVSTFALWIFAIIISVITSFNIAASFRSVDQTTKIENIACDSINSYYFTLSNSNNESLPINKDDIDNFNDFHLFVNQRMIIPKNGNISLIPEIEFHTSKDSCPEIKFIYYARGANKNEANDYLRTIKYNYEISDSTIFFDPYFYITSEKYRAQFLKIKVFIPEDHTFTIDESLAPIIDIEDANEKYEDKELTDKLIKASKSGFVII